MFWLPCDLNNRYSVSFSGVSCTFNFADAALYLLGERRESFIYRMLANNAKTRSNTRHNFYVENPYGKKPRAPTGDLHYNDESYNAGNTMSRQLFPCGLQDVYIGWAELTAVKHINKSANHITRTVGPPGVPTRHMLQFGSYITNSTLRRIPFCSE